jgi:hypothetical protein
VYCSQRCFLKNNNEIKSGNRDKASVGGTKLVRMSVIIFIVACAGLLGWWVGYVFIWQNPVFVGKGNAFLLAWMFVFFLFAGIGILIGSHLVDKLFPVKK